MSVHIVWVPHNGSEAYLDDDTVQSLRRQLLSYLSSNPLLDAFRRSGGGVGLEDELVTPEMTSHLPLLTSVIIAQVSYLSLPTPGDIVRLSITITGAFRQLVPGLLWKVLKFINWEINKFTLKSHVRSTDKSELRHLNFRRVGGPQGSVAPKGRWPPFSDKNSSGDEIANVNFFYNIAHVEASAYAHWTSW